ncbi:MAG: PEP-CTERM system TPR-repeat protein PrsT [Burkholderiales bacterium]|nr:PEP-CTERM system TPR-repeat protein PrsT [Burkholderiales bacterium]
MRTGQASGLRRSARLALALAAALALLPLGGHAAGSDKANAYYEDALKRYSAGDAAGAVLQLKNALQIDKNLLQVQVLMGQASLASSDPIAAEVAFTEALRLGVNRAEVVLPLAQAVVAQGKHQQLFERQQFALAGLPSAVQAQLLLIQAGAWSDLGNPREAMKLIANARAIDPRLASTWLAEVPIHIRTRNFAEATAAVDKAQALAPEAAEVHYQRGAILHVQGAQAKALAAYEQALRRQPDHVEALIARAGLFWDQNKVAEAKRDLAELQKVSPEEPRGLYLRAMILEREGNAAGARALLKELTGLLDPVPPDFIRYRPQFLLLGGLAHVGLNENEKAKPYLELLQRAQPNSSVSKLLANIYLGDKNIDKAIESLEAYLKGQPNDSQALALLASAHMAKGRYSRATALMQEALTRKESAQLRTVLGLSLAGAGRVADATPELEAAYRKDPTLTHAGVALVGLHLKARRNKQAVQIADQLVQRNPADAAMLNLQGMARGQSGDVAGATAAFQRAATLAPSFLAPTVNLARLEIATGKADAAEARLQAALKLDGKDVDALLELGQLLERRGKPTEAQRSLEAARDNADASNLRPGLVLVDYHLRGGRIDAAAEAVKLLTTRAPDDVTVLLASARVALAQGDATIARSTLTRASSLAGADPSVQLPVGTLQLQAGDVAGAAYGVQKVLEVDPQHLAAQAMAASVAIRQGEFARAELIAKQVIAKHPKLALGPGIQGDIALAQGQTAKAVDAYRRAHQAQPSTESLLRWMRTQASTSLPAAQQIASQWVQTHPNDRAVRRALADSHALARNLPAARAAYQELLKQWPDDVEVMNNLANMLIEAKDAPAALALAEKALTLAPGLAHVQGTAGWAAFQAGQTDRALQLLREARLRDPANPDTRYFLAAVLARAGRNGEARTELSAALGDGRQFRHTEQARALMATLK